MNMDSGRTVKQQVGVIFLCLGILLPVLSLVYLFKAERIYEAVSRIQIGPEQSNFPSANAWPAALREDDAVYFQTSYKNLTCRSLIQSVCDDLHLERDPRYAKKLDLVQAVNADISVELIPYTRLVLLKATHPDPRKAADIVNTLVTHFRERTVDLKRQAAVAILDRLRTDMTAEEARFQEASKELSQYRREHAFVPPMNGQCPFLEPLVRSKVGYSEAQARTKQAKDIVAAMDAHIAAKKPLTSFPPIAAGIRAAMEQLVPLEADFAAATKRYGEDAAETKVAQARVDAARSAVNRLAETHAEVLREEISRTGMDEASARATVDRWQEEITNWDRLSIGHEVLRRNADTAATLYSNMVTRIKETDLSARNSLNNILVIDRAVIPYKYVAPRILRTLALNLGTAAVLLLLGFTLAGAPGVGALARIAASVLLLLGFIVAAARYFIDR